MDQLKLALKSVQLSPPNPATEYFFGEYLELLNQPVLVDPLERTTRRQPTVGVEAVLARQYQLQERVQLHQEFIESLIQQSDKYWYEHQYWERRASNTLKIQNLGHLFNKLCDSLHLPQVKRGI